MSESLDIRIDHIVVPTSGYTAVNLQEQVDEIIRRHGLLKGIITLYPNDQCCFVVLTEYEPGLMHDLEQLLDRIEPEVRCCVAEALYGKDASLPVDNGETCQGIFKHPILIDVSGIEGEKKVVVVLEGVFNRD